MRLKVCHKIIEFLIKLSKNQEILLFFGFKKRFLIVKNVLSVFKSHRLRGLGLKIFKAFCKSSLVSMPMLSL